MASSFYDTLNFPNSPSNGNFYQALPFNPANLFTGSDKGGWWDTSDSSTLSVNTDGTGGVPGIGANVGRWMDKSGLANHFTAVTAVGTPIWSAEGIDTLPSGSRAGMEVNFPANITNATITALCVVKIDTITINDRVLSFSTASGIGDTISTTSAALLYFAATNTLNTRRNSVTVATSSGVSIGNKYLFEVQFDGNNVNNYVNGVAGTGSATSTAFAADYFRIGLATLSSGGEQFDGQYKELFVIDRALTSGELTAFRKYLNAKWTIY
jgi:hypothetical protein